MKAANKASATEEGSALAEAMKRHQEESDKHVAEKNALEEEVKSERVKFQDLERKIEQLQKEMLAAAQSAPAPAEDDGKTER